MLGIETHTSTCGRSAWAARVGSYNFPMPVMRDSMKQIEKVIISFSLTHKPANIRLTETLPSMSDTAARPTSCG